LFFSRFLLFFKPAKRRILKSGFEFRREQAKAFPGTFRGRAGAAPVMNQGSRAFEKGGGFFPLKFVRLSRVRGFGGLT
jgi:hypothetical protein